MYKYHISTNHKIYITYASDLSIYTYTLVVVVTNTIYDLSNEHLPFISFRVWFFFYFTW